MQVFRHVNGVFNSNTYLISQATNNNVYLIDPGSDSIAVLDWLTINSKELVGILLTHAHHDHIYGVNDLLDKFPKAKLYITKEMIEPLLSAKINISAYMENDITLNISYLNNIEFLEENSNLLLWDLVNLNVLFTPGHTIDSITFQINKYVFTGDSLIPGKKTVYRKKTGGNIMLSTDSINKIYNLFTGDNILLPGHGKEFTLNESKCVNEFCSLDWHSGFSLI